MTKNVWLYLTLALAMDCNTRKTPDLVKVAPKLSSEFPLDTSIRFQEVSDAAYGYTFATPQNFIEQPDTIGQVDSIVYFSASGDAKLIYFVEGEVLLQDTSKNYLYSYFHQVELGQHPMVKNGTVVKSQVRYDSDWLNYRGDFTVLGESGDRQFIWKTQLSEVPISGDLTYKTMLFLYPKTKETYYQPVGVALADKFGDALR